MPEERFTPTEAAAELRISRQTLYNWLKKEPELRRQLDKEHTLSRRQLDYLVLQQQKKPVKPTRYDLQDVDAALTERIEALEARMAALEGVLARARMPYSGPQSAIKPEYHQTPISPSSASTASHGGLPEGLIGWREFARLHGVPESTVQKARDDGRLTLVKGPWKVGKVWVQEALDAAGRARFYELWGHQPGFQQCPECPHT